MNMILNWFTKLQNTLDSLNDKGVDLQKIQTFTLIVLCLLTFIYTIIGTFFGECPLIPFAVTVVLFYYAMSFNSILNDE